MGCSGCAGLATLPENGSRCEPVSAELSSGQGEVLASADAPAGAASSAPPDFSFAKAAKGLFGSRFLAAAPEEDEEEDDGLNRDASPPVPGALA